MAKTLLDKLRAKTGVSGAANPANYLDRISAARRKLTGAGVSGVSKQAVAGEKPILNALGTIFPNVFGRFTKKPAEDPADTPADAPAADWGVYDWQSRQTLNDGSMPSYSTKRPFRRMRSGI